MINLLANKLILACSVGLVGVSVIALPTSLALTSGKNMGDIFKPLNDAIDTATTQSKTHFDTFDQQLNDEYTNFGNKVVGDAVDAPNQVSAQLQNISNGAKNIAQIANEYKEDGNYYAFQLGYLIKAVLKHIPNIIKESIVESIDGGGNKHLLSFQKIYNIAANEKFGEFLMAMTEVVKQYGSQLQNLSNEDTSGVIQIFTELQNETESITKFLGNVKTNSEELKNDNEAKTYCATKIMMHVLIGKKSMEEIKTTIEKLTALLATLRTQISGILQEGQQGINVDDLTQKLEEIKTKSEAINDPCPKPS